MKYLTSCANGVLFKPALGIRRRRGSSWKVNGPPCKAKHSARQIHHIRLIQTPAEVSVQDDIVGLDFPGIVQFDPLVETTEGCVPGEVGQV